MSTHVAKCIVTGHEKKFGKASLQRKIMKFGSLEMFNKYYVSKEASKLLKAGNDLAEVRKLLNSTFNGTVDIEVLYKLKLLKRSKRKTALTLEELREREEQSRENERKYHELQEKMTTCQKTWIEWATGGPNKSQVAQGGTCIRPDIYYDNEGSRQGRCKPCPYHEHCLCSNKEIV